MPATAVTPLPALRHEEFCQPTGGREQIRIEQYFAYTDNPETGRSHATHKVTRCMECGVAHYHKLEN